MTITKTINGNEAVFSFEGWLDTQAAPELHAEVEALGEDIKSIVFDFAKLDYISSAGLRVLLSANKAMVNSGKEPVKVLNSNEIVKEVFEVTGFSDILNIA